VVLAASVVAVVDLLLWAMVVPVVHPGCGASMVVPYWAETTGRMVVLLTVVSMVLLLVAVLDGLLTANVRVDVWLVVVVLCDALLAIVVAECPTRSQEPREGERPTMLHVVSKSNERPPQLNPEDKATVHCSQGWIADAAVQLVLAAPLGDGAQVAPSARAGKTQEEPTLA